MGAVSRITAYLSGGGLWNPELAHQDAVRNLLIDCRDELATAEARCKELEAALTHANIVIENETTRSNGLTETVLKLDAEIADLREKLGAAEKVSKSLLRIESEWHMVCNAWSREICRQGINFRNKTHWIDFMVLATREVVRLAKENGVRCCGQPELCANEHCNHLLRTRLAALAAEREKIN